MDLTGIDGVATNTSIEVRSAIEKVLDEIAKSPELKGISENELIDLVFVGANRALENLRPKAISYLRQQRK